MISDTVGPALLNTAAAAAARLNVAVQFNAAYNAMKVGPATPAPAPSVLSRPAKAREDGGKGRGGR